LTCASARIPCYRGQFATGLAGFIVLLSSSAAWAHVGHIEADNMAWNEWSLTPDIVIATLVVSTVYILGIVRRNARDDRSRLWRHAAFLGGVASVFLALASPIDHMAEHLFSVHQIQHLLLRMIAPMLIALSAPQAVLISGLPSALRRNALAPFAGNGLLQRLFSLLTEPVVVTALFIAALYVWEYPRYHDAALLNDSIHYTMHVTMLAAGLLFWWRIFDVRPAPAGLTYGRRLMMLWIVILSNIGLGAYTTLKSAILYPAYDVVGRLFGMGPLADETVGGFVIWVPSSMMCLLAAIIVIHMWGKHETRVEEKRVNAPASSSGFLPYPTTGMALVEQARPKNRVLAIGITAFAIAVFGSVIFVGILSHLNTAARHGLLAHASASATSPVR
jgi:putative membrane protein